METENSSLESYLNNHFPLKDAEWSSANDATLISRFWDDFKVYVRTEGNLYNFKYAQSLCERFDLHYVSECRGVIIRRESTSWKYASRPFDKFFNQNEGHSPVRDYRTFDSSCDEYSLVEKVDGTCIQLWYDQEKVSDAGNRGSWRISTLKKITPDPWVLTLFWKIFKLENCQKLDDRITYIFELCCEENEVVTHYPDDRVYLIGARETESGRHFTRLELDAAAAPIGVLRPRVFILKELGLNSLKDAKDFIEKEALKSDYGINPEGFVVFDKDAPLCKLKNVSYVEKHGIVTGNLLYVRNIVLERYWKETLDDVEDAIQKHPPIVKYLDELKLKVNALLQEAELIHTSKFLPLLKQNGVDASKGREYAELVKEVEPKWQPFFYSYKNHIDEPVSAHAYTWLKKNNTRFKNLWKETLVQEIIEAEKNQNKEAEVLDDRD
eukprot:TRINITY_DN9909_c0_g1_i1.p1 TRINITY_DN9909_c0_g1~~TRINITY_DN9909_c0_g1_i1.p1  ORF type:complete len:439 (+),score=116.96 TRINITY_DN9909_c0_g1_i1:105-1421(+)